MNELPKALYDVFYKKLPAVEFEAEMEECRQVLIDRSESARPLSFVVTLWFLLCLSLANFRYFLITQKAGVHRSKCTPAEILSFPTVSAFLFGLLLPCLLLLLLTQTFTNGVCLRFLVEQICHVTLAVVHQRRIVLLAVSRFHFVNGRALLILTNCNRSIFSFPFAQFPLNWRSMQTSCISSIMRVQNLR